MDQTRNELPFSHNPSVGQGERSHLTGINQGGLSGLGGRGEQIQDDYQRAKEQAKQKCQHAKDVACDKCSELKESARGAARRVEGNLRDDEGLKQELEPSTLEKAGEYLKECAQSVGETIADGARKVGLIRDTTNESDK